MAYLHWLVDEANNNARPTIVVRCSTLKLTLGRDGATWLVVVPAGKASKQQVRGDFINKVLTSTKKNKETFEAIDQLIVPIMTYYLLCLCKLLGKSLNYI